jgi:hypothetical protein
MKLAAFLLLLLLAAPWAAAQDAAKPQEAAKRDQAPKKPLILRIDQLPPAERSGIAVTEDEQKPKDVLPELGGKPSPAFTKSTTTGSGTEAPGSPYPANTQMNR